MIKNYAIQHKLEIIRTDEDMQAVLLVGGDGSEDSLLSVIEYFPEDSIISIFSCFPAYVEKKYFSSISLYLMGINNYVVTGHFELDTSLRQIHFRTSLPFRYFNPKDSILLKELLYTIRAMNEEVPGIYKELGIIVADSTNCGEEVLV